MVKTDIKKTVKKKYGEIAGGGGCCGPSCCTDDRNTDELGKLVGYSADELKGAPEGSNLGLGCGNPVALAAVREGDTVLDLGSGAGFDAFLISTRVGETGRVIGLDMTPEMVEKARANAAKGGYTNVEFILGEIEDIPLPDDSVDLIISNCVINLSPEKERVFNEAYRVLAPGGRLMVSDIVLTSELPAPIRESVLAYIGCIAGADLMDDYISKVGAAGFEDVEIVEQTTFPVDVSLAETIGGKELAAMDLEEIAKSVISVRLGAVKRG